MKIFSKVDPAVLLHIIHRRADFQMNLRQDLSAMEEPLQLAAICPTPGTAYRAHRHLIKPRPDAITQESWVIVEGAVEVSLYDTDGALLATPTLYAGDCSVTYRGGHGYRILSEGALVYEMKTGPYDGQATDKVFI